MLTKRLAQALTVYAFSMPVAAEELSIAHVLFAELIRADGQCSLLNAVERRHVEELYLLGLQNLSDPADQLRMESLAMNPEPVDCESEDVAGHVEMYRSVTNEISDSDAERESESEVTTADAQRMLQQNVDPLPKDRLGQIEGCWHGTLASWDLQLCFVNAGNGLDAIVSSPDGAVECAALGGLARERQGAAVFYAMGNDGKCSDGRSFGHLEGMCGSLADTEISCLVSVYSEGNYIFLADEKTENYLSGEAKIVRK